MMGRKPRRPYSAEEAKQPFVTHLIELRDRLLRIILGVLAIFLVLLPFASDLYELLAQPLMSNLPEGATMIATSVTSPFLAPFKFALVLAIFLAIPLIFHQFWQFLAPGLYQKERRLALPLLVSTVALFYFGVAFCHYIVLPLVFGFFIGMAPGGVTVMTDISSYLDFVLKMYFAFGLAFEVPVAIVLMTRFGVVEPDTLVAKRPYVIVGAFVLGMLLTPPDVISQTLLAVPVWLLFELGVLCARRVTPVERSEKSAAAKE